MNKLLLIIIGCIFLQSCNKSKPIVKTPEQAKDRNLIIVGFDGCRRERLEELMSKNLLPNLQSVAKRGSYVRTSITVDATETKPGWSQILSGYTSEVTSVHDNLRYQPIPKGLTIFERFKNYYGDKVKIFFVTGKINNTGARGPHDICLNCKTRFDETRLKTNWWEVNKNAPLAYGKRMIIQKREGEPFYNALAAIDFYDSSVPSSKDVFGKAKEYLDKFKNNKFLAFIHFEQPDETGHILGEDSQKYTDEIIQDDMYLGKILDYIRENNLEDRTDILIATDHGFKPNGKGHSRKSEKTWLVSSFKLTQDFGDRLDITPTIYEYYGMKFHDNLPAMQGKSMLKVK
jgi:predicted AlkP superfamily pyrophosphatase or phosphodiesterase